MRKGDSIIKKGLVLSLLVMYLFIALACIFYLPKYSPLRSVNSYTKMNAHQVLVPNHHGQHSAANIMVLLHRVYQSPFENKKDTSRATALVSIIVGGIVLFGLLKENGRYLNVPTYTRRFVYLSYCTLRI